MENKASSLKKLSLWQVTIIGIAYMTPMTVLILSVLFPELPMVMSLSHIYLLQVLCCLPLGATQGLAKIRKNQAQPIVILPKAQGPKVVFCRLVLSTRLSVVTTHQCVTGCNLSHRTNSKFALLVLGAGIGGPCDFSQLFPYSITCQFKPRVCVRPHYPHGHFCIFSGPGYWLYPRLRTCTYLGSAMAWSAITITTCCWGLRSMLFILRF